MRKSILSLVALFGFTLANAQLLEVASVEKVAVPDGMTVGQAVLSPAGDYFVVTPLSGQGLSKLDATGDVAQISATASIYNLGFTADGNNVVYRESSYDNDHRRFVAVKSYNVADRNVKTLVKPTRNLEGLAVQGSTVASVDNGRMKSRAINGATTAALRPVLSINRGSLCISDAAGTRTINPLGQACNSYLWPTLSPDGKRICAYGVGVGAFTCNLDGSDVCKLGVLRAMVWVNDDVLVGMDDHDNGISTIESSLIAVNPRGTVKQTLTNKDMVAVFPTSAAGKIGFTTPEGELYVLNLK